MAVKLYPHQNNEVKVLANPQDGRDKDLTAQGINGCAAAVYDAWNKATGLCRQAEVITHGIVEGGTKEFGREISKRPVETAINAGLSIGLGAGLSYLHLRHKLAHKVVGTIAGLFGIKATVDGFQHISKDQDFTSSLDAAYSHGDKATMDRSKAIAVEALAPDVVQFEVGALAGGMGYSGGLGIAGLRTKTFAKPWSQLMDKARKCLELGTERTSRSPVRDWPACDPGGNPFAEATKVEKKIIEEFVSKLQGAELAANPKFSYAVRRGDNGILQLEFKTFPSKEIPDYMHRDDRAVMRDLAQQLEKRIFEKFGVKVRFGESNVYNYDRARHSGNVILKHDFLKPEALNPQWQVMLVENKDIAWWEWRSDDPRLSRPFMRPTDSEKLVIQHVLDQMRKQLPGLKLGAQRVLGSVGSALFLDIESPKRPTLEMCNKLDLIMEDISNKYGIKPKYDFLPHESIEWSYHDDKVPISLDFVK